MITSQCVRGQHHHGGVEQQPSCSLHWVPHEAQNVKNMKLVSNISHMLHTQPLPNGLFYMVKMAKCSKDNQTRKVTVIPILCR